MASSRRPSLSIGIGVVASCSLCLQPIACRPDPKVIIAKIPMGSRLSQLDHHLTHFYEDSKVVAWIPNPTAHRGTDSSTDTDGGFDTGTLALTLVGVQTMQNAIDSLAKSASPTSARLSQTTWLRRSSSIWSSSKACFEKPTTAYARVSRSTFMPRVIENLIEVAAS